jgi:hypothetical protein
MASVPSDQLFTSSINLGEMFFGAYLAQPRTEHLLDKISAKFWMRWRLFRSTLQRHAYMVNLERNSSVKAR